MVPTIDFKEIRSHGGSSDVAFEELCVQLAALEQRDANVRFVRTGKGADGGVECYEMESSGDERGWQAKFVDDWAAAQPQLSASLKSALTKHPRLTRYIVCLPFTLPDGKRSGTKTARERYDSWRAKQEEDALDRGRILSIELWDASFLTEKLTRDDLHYAGRLQYWFDLTAFSSRWFEEKFKVARANLGARYSPQHHVDVALGDDLLAYCAPERVRASAEEIASRLEHQVLDNLVRWPRDTELNHANLRTGLEDEVRQLIASFDILAREPAHLSTCQTVCDRCIAIVSSALQREDAGGDTRLKRRERWAKVAGVFFELQGELGTRYWRAASAGSALLTGPAGVGKSHLVADLVSKRIAAGVPAVLVLGGTLADEDPWQSVGRELGIATSLSVDRFLGALDAAGEACRSSALVVVDALNEGCGLSLWPKRLAGFLVSASRFSHVRVLLTCRDTYLSYILPDRSFCPALEEFVHRGFADDRYVAVRQYLHQRGVKYSAEFWPSRDLYNPLFLKTCCDLIDRDGEVHLPSGSDGVNSIFTFYHRAITESIERALGLDPYLALVDKALGAFVAEIVSNPEGRLPYEGAHALFNRFVPCTGTPKSLLQRLVDEGVLSVEIDSFHHGPHIARNVRFTYERFADQQRARHWLRDVDSVEALQLICAPGGELAPLLLAHDSWDYLGTTESLSALVPERFGMELLDVLHQAGGPSVDVLIATGPLGHVFARSVRERRQSSISGRTIEIARLTMDSGALDEILIDISAEPDNRFNADWRHTQLAHLSMSDRDVAWSATLAVRADEGRSAAEELIDWVLVMGFETLDAERARLTALQLSWFLTTPHRRIRDRATKALSTLLASRLSLAAKLVDAFAAVDEPYAFERVVAAAYGAAIQGMDHTGLTKLCDMLEQKVFASRHWYPSVLVRDHTRLLLLYATRMGVRHGGEETLPGLRGPEVEAALELVSERWLEHRTGDLESMGFSTQIVASVVQSGDFARYVVDHLLRPWSATPLSRSGSLSTRQRLIEWRIHFEKFATSAQRNSLRHVVSTLWQQKDQSNAPYSEEATRGRDKAYAAFRESIPPLEWARFCVEARNTMQSSIANYGDDWISLELGRRPANFDQGWARRWIARRAHELGWTPERFEKIDRLLGQSDRMTHKCERIGKKYQWIALDELGARLSDEYHYLGRHAATGVETQRSFDPCEDGWRELDPSLLVSRTHHDEWQSWAPTWWAPARVELGPSSVADRIAWLASDADEPHCASLLEVADPSTGRHWLVLHTSANWKARTGSGYESSFDREVMSLINCAVVREEDTEAACDAIAQIPLGDVDHAFHISPELDQYVCELPWHPSTAGLGDWSVPYRTEVNRRATTVHYLNERAGHDYSVDENVQVRLPAPWLARTLGLRLRSGRTLDFVDAAGETQAMDPTTATEGPEALLVDRSLFIERLAAEGLVPIWLIAGERSVYGGRRMGSGFGGRRSFSAVYRYVNGALTNMAIKRSEYQATPQQLQGLEDTGYVSP